MRLKKMEAYGFKSFADKITIEFDDGITAVVGPNGSGKSNITDAIRWALGEQSIRNLRGIKAEDIIFSGTAQRRALGLAEVSLYFEHDGELPVDFHEVIVTRRLFRSGESEFYINRSRCRLKDIYNLFADTGIGHDGMSIIGQNRIDDILNSKPEERRGFFEETAGITKYRNRKLECLKKLENTQNELTRVKDLANELERELAPLSEAAKKKNEYEELYAKLRAYQLTDFYQKYSQAKKDKEEIDGEKLEIAALSAKEAKDIAEEEASREKLLKEAVDLEAKMESLAKANAKKRAEFEQTEKEIATLKERASGGKSKEEDILKERENILEDIENVKGELLGVKDEIAAKEADISVAKKAVFDVEKNYSEKQEKLQEKKSQRDELASFRAELEQLRQKLNEVSLDINSLKDRKLLLERLSEEYEGFPRAVRAIMQSKDDWRRGVVGAVSDLIETHEKYATAIEIALGRAAQNIVTVDENTAKAGISLLKRDKLGRATFLPLTTLTVSLNKSAEVLNRPGVLGFADDLIEIDERYKKVAAFLLGRTLIVDNMDNALALSKAENFKRRIVTLDGELIAPGGSITGGSIQGKSGGVFHRKGEILRLKEDISKKLRAKDELTSNVTEKEADLKNKEEIIAKSEDELSVALTELLADMGDKRTKLQLLEQEKKHESENYSRIEGELESKRKQLEKNYEDEKNLKSGLSENVAKLNELQVERDAKKAAYEEGERERDACYAMRMEKLSLINDAEKKIREKGKEKNELDEKIHQKELAISRLSLSMETAKNDLEESFQITVEAAAERILNEDIQTVRSKIREFKDAIENLGDINHGAIREYEELKGRYEFLTSQYDDIVKAKEDLTVVISGMDEEMERRFKEAFAQIEIYFDEIFVRLFGGGKANLRLIDENDVLNTGVEIIVELPKKKRQNLNALSGGERALTVVALLFAFLKYRPSPFSVLDEIDAPFDEANLVRFGAFLKEFSKDTQFIIVTHRKGTMEVVDTMYGVTVEEAGVSKILSIKIKDAVK
ncbi:MAG: AAA family ATPase [Selenomonadaceae bacterium]|nr:AAA family ATPase [Selenomonadaceae bacterium]